MSIRVLVRRPGSRLADGLLTHMERQSVDLPRAQAQWDGYVAALATFGWEVVEVPPLPAAPDGVFVEDTVVMLGRTALIGCSGAPERRLEAASVERVIAGLGYDIVHIEPPGCLDGGDVLKVGDQIYVGLSKRTNAAAVEQLRRVAADQGFTVIPVPISKVLHLKSAITALPDGTIIGHPDAIDTTIDLPDFVAVPEPSGAHVVVLDENTVLMASSAPESANLLNQRGLETVCVDISEFEKLEGCVTCLSVRLRT